MAMYDSKAVANYFLAKGGDITQMKLHKLIYYAHGWHLALTDKPLINESVEAWEYGPVVPAVYHEFKDLGSKNITRRAREFEFAGDGKFTIRAPAIGSNDERTKKILDRIWEVYGGLTAIQLSQMTHEQDSPWTETRKRNPGMKGVDIPTDLIKQYFKGRLQANKNVR